MEWHLKGSKSAGGQRRGGVEQEVTSFSSSHRQVTASAVGDLVPGPSAEASVFVLWSRTEPRRAVHRPLESYLRSRKR